MQFARATRLAVLLAAIGNCTPLGHTPFVCPEKGGDAWSELSSTHFLLRTDLERVEAERVIARLEAEWRAISSIGFGSETLPNTRVEVVYFRHLEEGRAITPRHMGVFNWSGRNDFERTPFAMTYGPVDELSDSSLRHELTHALVHYHYPQAPKWLNEGLAQYYQTLEMEGGIATTGELAPRLCFWNGPWVSSTAPSGTVVFIPASEAPAVQDLMGLEGEAFYGPPSSIANSWSADKANKAGELHYAGAFSLVRLLLVNPTYEKPFSNYLHQLHSGKSHAEAWETSVGALGAQKLEADYRAWLVPPNKTARRRPYPSTSPAPQSARSMSDAEIHVLWARLRDWSDHQARLAAEADIAEAALREPHHIEVSLARALMAMEYGDYAVAEKALTGSGAPPDRRLLNALGWMRLQALARNESPPWPAVGSALHPVAERLEPIAKSAAELDLLARYHRSRGEIAQGLLLERRALSADPTCIPCLVFTGQLLYADGHVEEALATAQRALSTLPDGAPPGPVIQQIAFYRSRLREKQGDKSATPGGAAPASSPQKKVDRNEKLNP